jgi:hypothetical protein
MLTKFILTEKSKFYERKMKLTVNFLVLDVYKSHSNADECAVSM